MANLASIASTAVMTISSLQGIGDVFKDDSLSDWEKFSSILMTLGFVVPNIIDAVDKLKEFKTVSALADKAGTAFKGLAAKMGSAVLAGGAVTLAIAAIVAVVALLIRSWKKWKD